MSLKAFHVVFISVSILLAFGFAVWEGMAFADDHRAADLAFSAGAAVAGVGLLVYGRYVLKKLKHISYL